MMAGARWRSSMVSNRGTIGRVQLSTPGASAKSPAGLREQVGAEDVAHASGHAQHERAERLAVDLLPQLADQGEHSERLGRVGRERRRAGRRR